MVVVPALDGLYCEASDLRRGDREGREMFLHSMAVLDRLVRRHDLAVLVSLSHANDLTAPVTRAATGMIRCEQTRFGPRFTVDSDDAATDRFETLAYPVEHSMVQTTLAFWREVLGRGRLSTSTLDRPLVRPVLARGRLETREWRPVRR